MNKKTKNIKNKIKRTITRAGTLYGITFTKKGLKYIGEILNLL